MNSIFSDLALGLLIKATLILLAGLIAAWLFRRRPAVAHQMLLWSLIGSLLLPGISLLVREYNVGVIRPTMIESEVTDEHAEASIVSGADLHRPADYAVQDSRATQDDSFVISVDSSPYVSASDLAFDVNDVVSTAPLPAASHFSAQSLSRAALIVWFAWSTLLLLRWASAFIASRRILGSSEDLKDENVAQSMQRAVARLGVQVRPRVRVASQISAPMIWCWGRPAILLVPASTCHKLQQRVDWVAVFTHELAHWQRRDHIAQLVADFCVMLLPFHPLVWLARRRLSQLSELACDDWAVSTGADSTAYADSLLNLVPLSQDQGGLALNFVSHGTLKERIVSLLSNNIRQPALASPLVLGIAVAMVAVTSFLALAQQRKQESTAVEETTHTGGEDKKEAELPYELSGQVMDSTGKPVAGATVYWFAGITDRVMYSARPRRQQGDGMPRVELWSRTKTNAQGKFNLLTYKPASQLNWGEGMTFILAQAKGQPFTGATITPGMTNAKLKFSKSLPIQGTIYTPNGDVAAGVPVRVKNINKLISFIPPRGWGVGPKYLDQGKLRNFPSFPETVKTDAKGKFEIRGMPAGGRATLVINDSRYASEELEIESKGQLSIVAGLFGSRRGTYGPKFEHTLQPGRRFQGQVVGGDNKKPIPNCLVSVVPMSNRGGRAVKTTTDTNGRYDITTASGQRFFVSVFPPQSAPYLGAETNFQSWNDASKPKVHDFALKRGVRVKGRMVEQGTNTPIAGASVVYVNESRNPNARGVRSDDPVLTKDDGTFEITVLKGRGHLVAEVAGTDWIRNYVDRTKTNAGREYFAHAFHQLNIESDEAQGPVDMSVRKGVDLIANVVTPDGKSAGTFFAYRPGMGARQHHRFDRGSMMSRGELRLPGTNPDKESKVFILSTDQKLGLVAKLNQKDDGTELRLKPTASIKGRILMPNGKPAALVQVLPMIPFEDHYEPSQSVLNFQLGMTFHFNIMAEAGIATALSKSRANAKGEFELDGLLADTPIILNVSAIGQLRLLKRFTLKPGETLDLGDLKLESIEP